MPTDPHATLSASEALQIVTDPERVQRRYALRILAWAHLMGARGKSVRQTQLAADARLKRLHDSPLQVVRSR